MESLSETQSKIFSSVIEIVTGADFNTSQQQFFHKNMTQFDENEENKLEYTNIYQDYVQMMEQVLDVTLKSQYGHSENDVDAFYKTFKENKNGYEVMNADVMDTLFSMVDFSKFKQSLLEYKKGMQDTDANDALDENAKLQQGKQGLELDEFLKIYEQDMDAKGSGWQRKLTSKDFKNGTKMQLWQKKNEIKGAPDWLRFDCEMKGISNVNAIVEYYKNPAMAAGEMIKEFTVFEEEFKTDVEECQKIYWRMKMPMMSERDNVARIYVKRLGDNKIFFKMTSIDDDRYPPNKQIIRMYQSVTGYQTPHETEPNRWNYTEVDQFDMKGHFPSRLFNMVLASSTKEEFQKMYNHIKDK